MFEVKYPNTHELDGSKHIIEIIHASLIENSKNKEIIVYGKDEGKTTMLILKYNERYHTYVFIPHTKMELVNYTSEFLERTDITEELIKRINGKKIYTIEDLEHERNLKPSFEVIGNKEINVKSDDKDSDYPNEINHNETINNKNNIKSEKKQYDKFEIDVEELFTGNYYKALKLIKKTILELEKKFHMYNNSYRGEMVYNCFERIINVFITVSEYFYTEDDLIDLGSFLAKIKPDRVNKYSDEEFNEVISKGNEIAETLEKRTKRRK